jgi:DNA polymerase-3 subunit epsilon
MSRTAPADAEFEALEGYARTLTASGWYRVARRFVPRARYAPDDGAATRTALFVDVETTGRDPGADAVIELAAVPFRYGDDGTIHDVGEPLAFLEDPGRPIPEEVTELTGITDEMVRGARIDDARVSALAESASLVIAHSARFDRPFVERRLPIFATRPWACSCEEVPWEAHGVSGRKLEYILLTLCGEFHDAHRALADCQVGIHVLAQRSSSGILPFAQLLAAAQRPTLRVWAVGSPYEAKDALKARGYRWSDGTLGRLRSWYRDLPDEGAAAAERAWLEASVYADAIRAGRAPGHRVQVITAVDRYSARG